MPRRQTCCIQREPCLPGHRSTERFSTSDQYSRTLCSETQCLAEFFKMFRFEFVAGKKRLDVVGRQVRFLQRKLRGARERGITGWATSNVAEGKDVVVLGQLYRRSYLDQSARGLLDVELFAARAHFDASEPNHARCL